MPRDCKTVKLAGRHCSKGLQEEYLKKFRRKFKFSLINCIYLQLRYCGYAVNSKNKQNHHLYRLSFCTKNKYFCPLLFLRKHIVFSTSLFVGIYFLTNAEKWVWVSCSLPLTFSFSVFFLLLMDCPMCWSLACTNWGVDVKWKWRCWCNDFRAKWIISRTIPTHFILLGACVKAEEEKTKVFFRLLISGTL